MFAPCPYCDAALNMSTVRFVAAETLTGDPVLGPDAAVRFRPVAFDVNGDAIAPDGSISSTPACGHCRSAFAPAFREHLDVPTIAVGPGGLTKACNAAKGQGWATQRVDFVGGPDDGGRDVSLVTCRRDDTSLICLLTTADGTPDAFVDHLVAGTATS